MQESSVCRMVRSHGHRLERLEGLAHRGGLATRLRRLRPEPGLIDRIGGRSTLERVIDRLYEGIAQDPLLQPLFGGRVRGEHRNQKQFFEEWADGEPRYRQAGTGHGMFLLHYRFGIDRKSAGRWLQYLVKAMREEGVAPSVVREVAQVLGPMAHALRHSDGPPLPPELRNLTHEQLRATVERDPELFERHRGEGRRLIFRAAEAGDVEKIEILASAGVSLDQPLLREGLMLTPWCVARSRGHGPAADFLRRKGARVDIFSAAYLADLELLETLLEQDPKSVSLEDPAMDLRGIQPLHHAIRGRVTRDGSEGDGDTARPKAVLLLLHRGAKPGPDSAQLLRVAADARWVEVVERLVAAGADVEGVGPGPWVLNAQISRLLIEQGADVNRPPGAWLAFCTARFGQQDDPDLVRRLLELGADTEARDREAGPLHLAAGAGHLGVIKMLLASGLDVDCLDGSGETPLAHVAWAVKSADRVATAELLLEHGADLEHRGPGGLSVRERLQRLRSRNRDRLLALLGLYGKESDGSPRRSDGFGRNDTSLRPK